jgi:scyllo-inositol 2-dehydrogenase (NADP+)
VETERGDYGAFYRGLVAAVRDGAPPPVAADDGVRVIEILERALHLSG